MRNRLDVCYAFFCTSFNCTENGTERGVLSACKQKTGSDWQKADHITAEAVRKEGTYGSTQSEGTLRDLCGW